MKNIIFSALLVVIGLFITGCSSKGHEFTPNFESVNELKDSNLKSSNVKRSRIGNTSVSLGRGTNEMTSPYGSSFQEYLSIALEEELKQASLYDKNSDIEISSDLLTNHLDTGISTGTAILAAKFIIKIKENEVLNKTYQIRHEWDSTFAAAIAIPRTLDNYVIAVQKLVDKFLLDKEVHKVLKHNKDY